MKVPFPRKVMSQVPDLGAPAKVIGMTLVVIIECQCEAKSQVALTNAQRASCEACGTIYGIDNLQWDGHGNPAVGMSATPVSVLARN